MLSEYANIGCFFLRWKGGVIRWPRLVGDVTEGTIQETSDVGIVSYLNIAFRCRGAVAVWQRKTGNCDRF